MSWICSNCKAVVYNACSDCPICLNMHSFVSKRPKENDNKWDEFTSDCLAVEIYRLYEIVWLSGGNMGMSPDEEKFSSFFNGEKSLISEMSDLEIAARRQELSTIASEARARLTAIQQEVGERQAKKKNKGVNVSVLDDDGKFNLNSDAITNITKSKRGASKQEKQIENLMSLLNISRQEAENMFSASNMLAKKKGSNTHSEFQVNTPNLLNQILGTAKVEDSGKGISNPFAAKEEPTDYPEPTEESLKEGERLNNERLKEVLEAVENNQPISKISNPFAK